MYRLLIVDDEPIIVDGLIDFFAENKDVEELELYWAYSAHDALKYLRSTRIDIVLTDIEMPEMNGLALQKEINRHWPRCKVIFLTGYNEFDYIQASSRNGALDYVLKTEGDHQILKAVQSAIARLKEELAIQQLVWKAKDQMSLALPLMQREFLLELLHGTIVLTTSTAGNAQLRELQIPLHTQQPLIMAIGRIDEWKEDLRHSDKMLFMFAVYNIAEEYLSNSFHMVQTKYDVDRFVWLLQPKGSIIDGESDGTTSQLDQMRPVQQLNGYIELIQSACSNYLKTPCSFMVASDPFPWEQISNKFDTLSFLFARGLGTRKEALLSEQQLFESCQEQQDNRVKMRMVQLLEGYLDKGQRTEFFVLFEEYMGMSAGNSISKTGSEMEIFYSMVSMFMTYINRWGLMKAVTDQLNINKIFNSTENDAWKDITDNFSKLAAVLFDERTNENEQQANIVILKLQEHIKANLDGDLSLTHLSEVVYLSPTYLSKLYKQVTGQSLTDYIIESRVQKAKELLLQTQLKIHKIARAVGFESAAYFTRCFKKTTTLTPQAFRDGVVVK